MHPKHMLTITPGVRVEGEGVQGQHRVGTLAHAITSSASYIIIGRSIVQVENRKNFGTKINKQIHQVASA